MYLLFGFAVVYAMGERAYDALHNRLALKGAAGMEDAHRSLSLSKGSTWWRKHVSVPALFGKRHAEPWALCSLPTRLQAIVVSLSLTHSSGNVGIKIWPMLRTRRSSSTLLSISSFLLSDTTSLTATYSVYLLHAPYTTMMSSLM